VELINQGNEKLWESIDHLLFVPGDMPLIRAKTLEKLIETHLETEKSHPAKVVITIANLHTAGTEDLTQMTNAESDRIGNSQADAEPFADPRGVIEDEGSIYYIPSKWYGELFSQAPAAVLRDFQLSSLVQFARSTDLYLSGFQISDRDELLRITSQVEHAKAEAVIRSRTNLDLMHKGIAIIDPNSTFIDVQVEIGEYTIIHPQTYLRGSTSIGSACEIGPNSLIQDTSIGDRCKITFSVTENAVLEDDVDIGPFAHLRKGAHLARGVHMGNYGEVKNPTWDQAPKWGISPTSVMQPLEPELTSVLG